MSRIDRIEIEDDSTVLIVSSTGASCSVYCDDDGLNIVGSEKGDEVLVYEALLWMHDHAKKILGENSYTREMEKRRDD